VQGFIVEHCGSMLVEENAGILVKSNYNVIEQNNLRDILFGIYLMHAERNSILNNTIVGRRHLEVGERGSAFTSGTRSTTDFLETRLPMCAMDSIFKRQPFVDRTERSAQRSLRGALHVCGLKHVSPEPVHRQRGGGSDHVFHRHRMRHNVFSHNRGFSSFGILFQDCHGLIADSNVIADNVVGMFFESSTDNVFHNNVIAQNDVALQMFQNSINNSSRNNSWIISARSRLSESVQRHVGMKVGAATTGVSYDGYRSGWERHRRHPMKIQNVFQYLERTKTPTCVCTYTVRRPRRSRLQPARFDHQH